MRLFLLILSITAVVVACSPTRRSYYFDRYRTVRSVPLLTKQAVIENKTTTVNITAKGTAFDSASAAQDLTLVASTSGKNFSHSRRIQPLPIRSHGNSNLKNISFVEKQTNASWLLNKEEKKPQAIQGDGKKEGFAVMGFSFSIIGLLGLLGFLLVLGFILLTLGVVFSIAGLKSKRKRLALLGLMLGGIPLVAIAVMILAFLLGGGYDM